MPSFVKTAKVLAKLGGVPDLRIVVYPGAINNDSDTEVAEKIEKEVMNQIVDAFTKPGDESQYVQSKSAPRAEPGKPVFEGSIDEVNKFFWEQGWTDGLPVIPPTTQKVEEYLEYTDLSPDQEIAVLPQANFIATPRNIASNAIMAGCPPQFMPLLIAAVEAVADPEYQLLNIGSTICMVPWLLVNGPIIKQLGIEYEIGLASRGPNPVIGRAFQLILRNIAGFKPGETLMGVWGYFSPFVMAENEDRCYDIGWKPYHVERGFDKSTSTVTIRTTCNWGFQVVRARGSTAEPILKWISKQAGRIISAEIAPAWGSRNMVTVLITPPTAKVIARDGYSKRDVAEYVWENTTVPKHELVITPPSFSLVSDKEDVLFKSLDKFAGEITEGLSKLPERFEKAGPDDLIPLLATASPDVIDVVVCGDTWRDKAMNFWSCYNRPVTKEIRPFKK
ncbi:hypothetical protein ACFLW4_05560 [Chloroflexota bacterium]